MSARGATVAVALVVVGLPLGALADPPGASTSGSAGASVAPTTNASAGPSVSASVAPTTSASASGVATTAASASGGDDGGGATVRDLVATGLRAKEAGEWAACSATFRAAYTLRQTAEIAALLAECEAKSGASVGTGAASVSAAPSVSASATAGSGRSRAPALVAGVAAVGLLGLGVALTVTAVEAQGSVDELQREVDAARKPCGNGGDARVCQKLDEQKLTVSVRRDGALVGFLGGVLLSGAIALYLFWPEPKTPATTVRLRVAPAVGQNSGGLVISGAF